MPASLSIESYQTYYSLRLVFFFGRVSIPNLLLIFLYVEKNSISTVVACIHHICWLDESSHRQRKADRFRISYIVNEHTKLAIHKRRKKK